MPDRPTEPAWVVLSDDGAGSFLATLLGGDPLPVRDPVPAPHHAYPWPGIECFVIDATRMDGHRLLALAEQMGRVSARTTDHALQVLVEGYPIPAGFVAEVYTGRDGSGILVSAPAAPRRTRHPVTSRRYAPSAN